MLNIKRSIMRSMPILLVVVGFVAGLAYSHLQATPREAESALQGTTNTVYEMSSAVTVASPVLVMDSPTGTTQVDRLLWGDRVLWRGNEQTDAAGNRWIYVSLSEGVNGWMQLNIADASSGKFKNLSPQHFTTPGIELGSQVVVTDSGAGANLRNVPSVAGSLVRKLGAGESYAVVGGPYQSEYYVWWKLLDTNSGVEGWVVDVEGWIRLQ